VSRPGPSSHQVRASGLPALLPPSEFPASCAATHPAGIAALPSDAPADRGPAPFPHLSPNSRPQRRQPTSTVKLLRIQVAGDRAQRIHSRTARASALGSRNAAAWLRESAWQRKEDVLVGLVTSRDVLLHFRTIWTEFGPAVAMSCLSAIIWGRRTTFLNLVFENTVHRPVLRHADQCLQRKPTGCSSIEKPAGERSPWYGLADYFLGARPVGPSRGSCAGRSVSWPRIKYPICGSRNIGCSLPRGGITGCRAAIVRPATAALKGVAACLVCTRLSVRRRKSSCTKSPSNA